MNRPRLDSLAQMNRDYFQSLDKEKLVEVAGNLHQLAVEQLERLEQNSSNSSRPPSSDSPYEREAAQSDEAEIGASKTDERVAEGNSAGYGWLFPSTIAVYHIGSRKKEELLHLISDAFIGWLVTDGYGAYSTHEKRSSLSSTLNT